MGNDEITVAAANAVAIAAAQIVEGDQKRRKKEKTIRMR